MHGMAIRSMCGWRSFPPVTPEEAMNAIVPNYVAGFIYGALVESFCSEQNARMMAMDAATDNADALLKDLIRCTTGRGRRRSHRRSRSMRQRGCTETRTRRR